MKRIVNFIIFTIFLVLSGCGSSGSSGSSSSFNESNNKPIFISQSKMDLYVSNINDIKGFHFTFEVEDASEITYIISQSSQDFKMFTLDLIKGILRFNIDEYNKEQNQSTYRIVIIAIDALGHRAKETFIITINNDISNNDISNNDISNNDTPQIINSLINQSPIANAGKDITVILNKIITLRGGAIDHDGQIISYVWRRGDSVLSTTATFEYLSTVVGQDKLTLTVMDDDGAISSDTILITVKDIVSSVTWVTPTKNICKKYDGQYYGNQCSANLENAQIICSTIGASLPTIETLRAIVINCGGVVNDYDNISNKEYQFCYKEEGFSHNVYWSMSSPNDSLTSSTWTLNFSGGNDGRDRETNKFNVRCNR